jgi:hypothetical protein
MYVPKITCTRLLTVTSWKQTTSTVNKLWYIKAAENYTTIKEKYQACASGMALA